MYSNFNPTTRKFNKRTFKDLLNVLVPEVYKLKDLDLSGAGSSDVDLIIDTHLNIAKDISSIISVSSIPNSKFSNLNSIEGIRDFFIKQYENTKITNNSFEINLLNPIGKSFLNFDNSASFYSYLKEEFIPSIRLATASDSSILENNMYILSSLTGENTASSVHGYLLDNLGWFYLLNTSANGNLSYEPSSYVLDSLATLYRGNRLDTVDGIKGLTSYIWKNYQVCSTFEKYIPDNFVSSVADSILEVSDGTVATYTSGTQRLDNLLTLIDVLYSPFQIDKDDFKIKNAFDEFLSVNSFTHEATNLGPFSKFLTAIGYSVGDLEEEIEKLKYIYDIKDVDSKYLQEIANLIGWEFIGIDKNRWRQQLMNAVEIYKKRGTLKGIRALLDNFIFNKVVDLSATTNELWESYIPFIIWYSLATESEFFKSSKTWTQEKANKSKVYTFIPTSLESNIKIVVDFILLNMYKKFPENFSFNGNPWPVNKLLELDENAKVKGLYTIPYENGFKDFFIYKKTDPGFSQFEKIITKAGQKKLLDECYGVGPLGEGHYFGGLELPDIYLLKSKQVKLTYLKPIGDINFVFNYRSHKKYPIPPFEELKYFVECDINKKLINYLISELKCFGVNESFAQKVKDFLYSATLTDTDALKSLNSEFLFFFKNYQLPPNYNEVLNNIDSYVFNLIPLWNGKSSHLLLDFDEASFSFNQNLKLEKENYDLYNIAQFTKKFIPAHTILKTNYTLSSDIDNITYSSTNFDYVDIKAQEDDFVGYGSGSVLAGFEGSGVTLGYLGKNDVGMPIFKRQQAENLLDPTIPMLNPPQYDHFNAENSYQPRRSARRRNLKNTLPLNGYYDRTGFNPPTSFDPSVLENSMASSLGVLTLGFIPSSNQFYPVGDVAILSGVWNICESLKSSNTYFGVDTSNTFPFRGLYEIGSDAKTPEISSRPDRYLTRGELPEIYSIMHRVFERQAFKEAEEFIELQDKDTSKITKLSDSKKWKAVVQSYANTLISNDFVINSFSDYENFKFGKGLHKLYKNYTNDFGRHSLLEKEKTGGNIFAHTYGYGVYNCNFEIAGSASQSQEGSYIASSLSDSVKIANNNGSGVFSISAVNNLTASGTYVASSSGDLVLPINKTFVEGSALHAEYRNPHILSGIEFVDTSGSSKLNSFEIFKVDKSLEDSFENKYLIENTVIKCKTGGGIPRIRLDLSSYGETQNKLVTDHDFEFRINCVVADEKKNEIGAGKVGVWIHTNPVNGYFWSWSKNNEWIINHESELSDSKVKYELAHVFDFFNPSIFNTKVCASELFSENLSTKLASLDSSIISTITVPFNTRNYTIFNNYIKAPKVPEYYYKLKNQIHTNTTNYIIEVFFFKPASDSKYLLIDSFELQDMTLKEYAGIPVEYGIETSSRPNLKYVDQDELLLNKYELGEVLRYFNGLINTPPKVYNTLYKSRVASDTSGIFEASGGSRLNYRLSPYWHTHEKNVLDDNPSNATNYSFQVSSVTFIN